MGNDNETCTMDNTMKLAFIKSFTYMQESMHQNAVEHGWWEDSRGDGECIALMHSELSEALEGLRDGNPPSVKCEGYTNVEEELADCIIRIMDYAEAKKFNVAGAIINKHNYNTTREYKHGREF